MEDLISLNYVRPKLLNKTKEMLSTKVRVIEVYWPIKCVETLTSTCDHFSLAQ